MVMIQQEPFNDSVTSTRDFEFIHHSYFSGVLF